VHNSLFLIAHFHSVIIGGVLFGFFSGYSYWFPKFTGFRLNEKLGKYAFWFWFVGFIVAFFPLYLLGFMGATRRMNHYPAGNGWQPLFIVASIGAFLILIGVLFQAAQLYKSIKERNENKDTTGDPWNGRALEWSTASPPPFYNFAHLPEVHSRDAFWELKKSKKDIAKRKYEDIHMPKNSMVGVNIGILSCVMGFALVWHIFWLAAITFIGILVALIARLFVKETDYYVKAEEVEQIETRSRAT
jgi:cytochrome o ubiquinol oxidase subunit 1